MNSKKGSRARLTSSPVRKSPIRIPRPVAAILGLAVLAVVFYRGFLALGLTVDDARRTTIGLVLIIPVIVAVTRP